jgi:hypothetical protein
MESVYHLCWDVIIQHLLSSDAIVNATWWKVQTASIRMEEYCYTMAIHCSILAAH